MVSSLQPLRYSSSSAGALPQSVISAGLSWRYGKSRSAGPRSLQA
jgi:hypothetical protein